MEQTIRAGQVMNFLEEEELDLNEIPLEDIAVKPVEAPSESPDAFEPDATSSTDTIATSTMKTRSGTRLTPGNAELIRFLSKFPGATPEALSIIAARQDQASLGHLVLPTIKGTEKRLRKMESLGAVERIRDATTGAVQYSATQLGIDALWSFGIDAEHGTTLHKKTKTRISHYRYIAHVAAQFASPTGFFRESLGIEPVSVECLISENEMRAAYEPIKEWLVKEGKQGRSSDFGKWRLAELQAGLGEAGRGNLAWSDIVEVRPALLTVGQPRRAGTETKAVHQPDLAVIRDATRTSTRASNILVEVELSKKSWDEYNSILKTLKMELEHGFIYERAVYFTVGPQVETLLRKVDKHGGYELFSTGRLVVLPILDRNGEPVRFDNRVILGAS
jgi:hypothetical protein